MGLSAYGKLNLNLYEKFFVFIEKMSQLDNTNDYNFLNIKTIKQKVVRDLFKNILNDTIAKNNIRPEDICFTLQKFSEDYVLKYLKIMRQSNNLCLAGGLALNGYINNLIIKNKIYKNIHIGPATGDSGLSIGATLFIANKFKKTIIHDIQYIGNSLVVNENIFKNLKIKDIQQIQYNKLYDIISDYIINGKIIGWMQGRSESGPRALGNRSILCDPRDPNMKDYLNNKVKHREWYRPFAPSIMKEYVEDWFEDIKEDKFMLRIPKYKEGMGEKVPAVCHVDYTGRVQTVTEKGNKHFYNLIKAFYEKTGIPILLNTSFNDNEEPIIDSIEDAINTFNKTGIDILVLKNYIMRK
jgi:carbamoyltransferase